MSGRGAYVARRFAFALVTIFVAATMNFIIFRAAPGDPVSKVAQLPNASPQLRESLRREFGLDKSQIEQYALYMREALRGNLGISYTNRQSVTSNILHELKNTVPMVVVGTLLAIVLGLATGISSARLHGSLRDKGSGMLATAFYSMPQQWLGLMLIALFSGLLPVAGIRDPFLFDPSFSEKTFDYLAHLTLPAVTLGLSLYGGYTLIVRAALLEALGEDYMLLGRAKGLSPRRLIWRYALPDAMPEIITLIALSLGYTVSGTILVETVFSWPGIGQAIYHSVASRDYPMLQGLFLVVTVTVIIANLVADLVCLRLDPRITD